MLPRQSRTTPKLTPLTPPLTRTLTPQPAERRRRPGAGSRRGALPRLAAALCGLAAAVGLPAGALFAQDAPAGGMFRDVGHDLWQPLALAVVFTLVGLVLFAICIALIVKVTPFSVQKEIEDDQNIALGIIIGSMILGIAIILAASIIG